MVGHVLEGSDLNDIHCGFYPYLGSILGNSSNPSFFVGNKIICFEPDVEAQRVFLSGFGSIAFPNYKS